MAGFRGFGDDAMKVQQDQRQAGVQMAQIAASAAASKRAASVTLAGQAENGRQADMANELATDKLEQNADPNSPSNATKLAESRGRIQAQRDRLGIEQQKVDTSRKGLEQTAQFRKDQLGLKMVDSARQERQLQLNEATYARMAAEAQKQQAAQDELAQQDTAAQLAVMRAASVSSGPLGMAYINFLNNVRGVAYGDPGSVTQVFPVIDPNTGARLGIGTVKIGDDGKPVQAILDPHVIIPKVLASMTPDKAEEFSRQLISGNTAKGSDRMTAAALKYAQQQGLQYAKTSPVALVKTLSEQEDELRSAKPPKAGGGGALDPANQENLDRVRQIKTNVLKDMEAKTSGATATPATMLSPEQAAAQADFVAPSGEVPAKTDATVAPAAKTSSALIEGGNLAITIDGQTKRVKDTPANRAWLKTRGIALQ